ncbi:hypothetical protein L1049_024396 [Liquidambar formosana]|uniref:F-box domain-containing protein n=1 Tax=Liquidambar formosana TaxID=63359 RepID=A0AAP0RVR2_LIQFO
MEQNQSKKNRNQEEEMVGVDRISNLPDHVIHHILFFLPTKDIICTSIVSKRWVHLFATFPIIDLNEEWYLNFDVPSCRERFLDSMRLTLLRRSMMHLDTLQICTVLLHDNLLDFLLDRFIALAMRGNVRVLDLEFATKRHTIPEEECNACYVLPRIIFSAGSCLVCLMVEGCIFKVYNAMNFQSLKTLSMVNTHIRDEMLMEMICCCPSIESLTLERCHGLKTIRVFNGKLEHLRIRSCRELEAFEMDVPSLQSFKYKASRYLVGQIEILGFKTTSNSSFSSLTTFVLTHVKMTAEIFQHMISSFPQLVIITLKFCEIVKRPKIVFAKLKKFMVEDCNFRDKVDIMAPDLEYLTYVDNLRGCTFIPSNIDVGFRALKTLSLEGHIELSDESLQFVCSYCHLLEHLSLRFCSGLKYIKICNYSLKSLLLEECGNVEDCNIDAPILLFFKYVGPLLEFSYVNVSNVLDTKLHLRPNHRDNYQPFELRNLLWKFNQARVITLICKLVKVHIFT